VKPTWGFPAHPLSGLENSHPLKEDAAVYGEKSLS